MPGLPINAFIDQPDERTAAIIIAAGMGARMGTLTSSNPKCLLPIRGRALLDWTLDNFIRYRCDPLVAIVGYLAHQIDRPGLTRVENEGYRDNNILHSMMQAVEYLNGPAVVSYSDIWVEPSTFDTLMSSAGDIVLCVDMDWRQYYAGRTDHPVSEAEKAYIDDAGRVVRIGKHLPSEPEPGLRCGEFVGLWRMSRNGSTAWVSAFQRLNAMLAGNQPFQHAAEWRRAYATDLMQHLIEQGVEIRAATICRGWAELDTAQDYLRLLSIASEQRLYSLLGQSTT